MGVALGLASSSANLRQKWASKYLIQGCIANGLMDFAVPSKANRKNKNIQGH